MAKRVAGTCYVKCDSAQLEVQGGVECPASDVNRETVMGLAGPAGYKETARAPYIKLTAIATPDFPRKTLADSTDMTITAELANGIVENADLFAQNLIVERDANNPNRLNVLFPPDLVNQLRVFAVLAQFRLQYPATA